MKIAVLAILFWGFPTMVIAQKIENVDFRFNNHTITVFFDLTNFSSNYTYDLSVKFVTENGEVIIPKNIYGDVKNVHPGPSKSLVWHVLDDDQEINGNFSVVVEIAHRHFIQRTEANKQKKRKKIETKKAEVYSTYYHPYRTYCIGYLPLYNYNAFYFTKSFKSDKYKLQLAFSQYGAGDNITSTSQPASNRWNKYAVNFAKNFTTKTGILDFNFSIGPSVKLLSGKYANTTTSIGQLGFTYDSGYVIKMNDWFFNLRIGCEIIISDRIVIHGDFGVGYATQGWDFNENGYEQTNYSNNLLLGRLNYDYDLFVGYKFGLRRKRRYSVH